MAVTAAGNDVVDGYDEDTFARLAMGSAGIRRVMEASTAIGPPTSGRLKLMGLLDRRHRHDEDAWRELSEASAVPADWDFSDRAPMFGRVGEIYQHAHRGTKAVVHFGPRLGPQDTWWPYSAPPTTGSAVLVRAHLWRPPGTHSGEHVWWIDALEQTWAPGLSKRAERHEKRVAAGRYRRIPAE